MGRVLGHGLYRNGVVGHRRPTRPAVVESDQAVAVGEPVELELPRLDGVAQRHRSATRPVLRRPARSRCRGRSARTCSPIASAPPLVPTLHLYRFPRPAMAPNLSTPSRFGQRASAILGCRLTIAIREQRQPCRWWVPMFRFLFDGRLVVKPATSPSAVAPSSLSRTHFSFGARSADRSWELSLSLNSMQGRQAARKREELSATVVDRWGEKTWLRESMCQEVIRSFRATEEFAGFLPCRAAIAR